MNRQLARLAKHPENRVQVVYPFQDYPVTSQMNKLGQ